MSVGASEVQSVNRALDLLQHVADAGGTLGLSQLARESGLPLSTVHRMTRSLVAGGYLTQRSDRRYSLGLRLVALGDAANRSVETWTVAQLQRLVAVTGETANAATLAGDSALYVAQVESGFAMRTSSEVGRRVPALTSAAGLALLSGLGDAEVVELVSRSPAAGRAVGAVASALLDVLHDVRRDGFALAEEEPGSRCVAVPVPGAPVPLAIAVSGPVARLTDDRLPRLAVQLRRSAAAPIPT